MRVGGGGRGGCGGVGVSDEDYLLECPGVRWSRKEKGGEPIGEEV